jgi:5-methylcytosine-specific restriction protein A
MGLNGDQSLEYAQNKTLALMPDNGVSVHLFEMFGPRQYTYLGQVKLDEAPYQERQADESGVQRNVWVFPLKLIDDLQPVLPETTVKKKEIFQQKKAKRLSDQEIEERVQYIVQKPGERIVATKTYERNQYVSEYAKRRAGGVCQLCDQRAPFVDKNGEPYLETHHIVWLSQGGDDSIENTVALCPNCHRKMHIVNDKADVESLKAINVTQNIL